MKTRTTWTWATTWRAFRWRSSPRMRLWRDAGNVMTALESVVAARTNDIRDSQGLSIELPAVQDATDFNVQTYQQEAGAIDTATHWSEFLNEFETGAGASGSSTASQWAGNNGEAAFAFDLHEVLGNGLTFSGLQIGPISSGARPARTSSGSGSRPMRRGHQTRP